MTDQYPPGHPEINDVNEVRVANQELLSELAAIVIDAGDTLDDLFKRGIINHTQLHIRETATQRFHVGRQVPNPNDPSDLARYFIGYVQLPLKLDSTHVTYRLSSQNGVYDLARESGDLLAGVTILNKEALRENPDSLAETVQSARNEKVAQQQANKELRELVPGISAVSVSEAATLLDDLNAAWMVRKVELHLP